MPAAVVWPCPPNSVVYAKEPFAGPQQVLRYLSRYTHRIAISNRRLVSADENGVAFKYKDYRIDGPGDASSARCEAAWSVTNDGTCFRHGTPFSAIQIGRADQIDFLRPLDSSSLAPSNMKAVRDIDGYRFLYAGGYILFFVRPYLPSRSRMNVMSQALCGADCWLRHREGRFGNWPTSVFGSSSRGVSC